MIKVKGERRRAGTEVDLYVSVGGEQVGKKDRMIHG